MDTLLNQRARFQMPSPNLAGSIGEAQVEVHAIRTDGAIEGDHLQIALQDSGFSLAGALKSGSSQIADHAQYETVDALVSSDVLEVETQITAGIKLQRQ